MSDFEQEIRGIAKDEALKNQKEVVFPDVQRVEVENWPEQKDPVVNVNVPEVKLPPINIPKPEVTVEAPVIEVEAPDLTAIAKGLSDLSDKFTQLVEKQQPEIDYEKLEEIQKKYQPKITGHGGVSSKRYSLNASGQAINPATEGKQDDIITAIGDLPQGGASQAVQMADSPSIDAFARLRTSEPSTLFDSKQINDNQPLFWDDAEVSGGGTTTTYNTNEASTTIAVAATTAGKRVRQTFQRFNYQPGKSQLIFMTGTLTTAGASGVVRCMGMYDDNNGLFLKDDEGTIKVVKRTYTSGSVVDTEVAQTAWNLDKMDGTGASGFTLDPTKSQIMVLDLEWLGVGRVRMGFVVDGIPYYVHEFTHSNKEVGVYMSTPNLPLRYEIENDGTGGASELECICGSVMAEGGVEEKGVPRYRSTAGTHVDANSADTVYAVVGVRLKAAYLDAITRIKTISMLSQTNDDFEWLLILNPTVAGTFTYSDETNSAVQTATGATANTVTGGTIIGGGFSKNNAPTQEPVETLRNLGAKIDNTVDEIVLCVRPLTANADIEGSITWLEVS